MSDAIRCWQCRWWLRYTGVGTNNGECELNPPVYIGGDPISANSWWQPVTRSIHGCSHGERRPEPEGEE